jgi:hypothetical protein
MREQAVSQVAEQKPVVVFYSYCHRDERLRDRLAKHLAILRRSGVIAEWYDREIGAGEEWRNAIDDHLNSADIILLLVSADFIASDYCWDKEVALALDRHTSGAARVIPIIVQPVDWTGAPFGRLQALPKDGKAVTLWSNREKAWDQIAKAISKVAQELQRGLPLQPPPSRPPMIPTGGARRE